MMLFFMKIAFLQNSKLYIPLNIQHAIKAETRTKTGIPGKNYWQNRANYDINVQLAPEERIIKGDETIHYQNISPDTLSTYILIFIRIFLRKGT